jgi:hypothetical protein
MSARVKRLATRALDLAWSDVTRSRWRNPFQELFHRNQDVFNTKFSWDASSDVHVFRNGGSVEQRRR